jgi:hypothetical protein
MTPLIGSYGERIQVHRKSQLLTPKYKTELLKEA